MSAFTSKSPVRLNALKTPVTFINGERKTTVDAIWDTGATCSCITQKVASELNLIPLGETEVASATEVAIVPLYNVDILLTNKVSCPDVPVYGVQDDCLIGMDIIGLGDFCVSGANGGTTFSFRIPAERAEDYVKEENLRILVGEKHGKGNRKRKK